MVAALSHDGKSIAGHGPTLTAVWDVATGKANRLIEAPFGKRGNRSLLTFDGKQMASVSVRLIGVGSETGKLNREWPSGGMVGMLRFSSDGKHLLASGDCGVALVRSQLAGLAQTGADEQRRAPSVVSVLRQIGTKQADALLADMADGKFGDVWQKAAKAGA